MYIVVLITTKNTAQAKKIARVLLSKKLIACSNIVKSIDSFFLWKGKVDSAKEALLILKTEKKYFQKIVKEVETMHSYDIPEIIALPIISGNQKYLKWIKSCLKK